MSQSCSLILVRRGPVPSLTILEENSTPIVCDDSTLPTGARCISEPIYPALDSPEWMGSDMRFQSRTFVLDKSVEHTGPARCWGSREYTGWRTSERGNSLSGTTWTKKNNLGQIIIHALQLLVGIRTRCLKDHPSRAADFNHSITSAYLVSFRHGGGRRRS